MRSGTASSEVAGLTGGCLKNREAITPWSSSTVSAAKCSTNASGSNVPSWAQTSAGRCAAKSRWRSKKPPSPSSSQVETLSASSSVSAVSPTVASTCSSDRLALMASETLYSERASRRRMFSAESRCFSRPRWTTWMTSSTLNGFRM